MLKKLGTFIREEFTKKQTDKSKLISLQYLGNHGNILVVLS